jgi:hypothetical protein
MDITICPSARLLLIGEKMKQIDRALKVLCDETPKVTAPAGKRIEVDGKFYRMRRGKLVLIPDEWVGSTVTPQTKRKRLSKAASGKKADQVKHMAGRKEKDKVYNRQHKFDGQDMEP